MAMRIRLGETDGTVVNRAPIVVAEIERSGKVSLCRRGGTANQPFCDGSHPRVGFRSAR